MGEINQEQINTEELNDRDGIHLFGRREILTALSEITKENLPLVLDYALAVHGLNAAETEYLYRYMRGLQPVLARKKTVRPEICNKVVENHAAEIVQFTSGYFLGEPVTYVRRNGAGEKSVSDEINLLNSYMMDADKITYDKDLATWMAICGNGYRMVLPNTEREEDEAPFAIETLDPRNTFVVYYNGFGHRRMLAGRVLLIQETPESFELMVCGYTRTHYFEFKAGQVLTWIPHALGDIPIFEYKLNMSRMGSFEPAIPMLDAINLIQSNRVDDLEQFVQSFLKFINCDVDEEDVEKLRKLGAIKIKSVDGLNGDVQLISQALNQEQTQTLVDWMYDQVLVICGMPTTTKGGASTSDTGNAVFLRDGWAQCEARAKDTETLFKKSEREFLRLVLKIIREIDNSFTLRQGDVECKFTRRQHDNLQSKTQALMTMLQAGLDPGVAIAASGLFNDPSDVTAQSAKYLAKWEPKPMTGETPPETTEEAEV